MEKQIVSFYTQVIDGVVIKVGKTSLNTPKCEWNQKGIKWFEDTGLIKDKACG